MSKRSDEIKEMRDELESLRDSWNDLESRLDDLSDDEDDDCECPCDTASLWRAKEDMGKDEYFYITDGGEVDSDLESGCTNDDYRYMSGNYFKTEKQAEVYLENQETAHKLRVGAAKAWKDTAYKLDWANGNTAKTTAFYDYENKTIFYASSRKVKEMIAIAFPDEDSARKTIKQIGERRVIQLLKS